MVIKDKIALVTGSTHGIGKAIAFALAQKGATVILNCSKDIKNGKKVLKEIQNAHGKALFFPADVSNPKEVKQLFEKVKKLGKLDILVNNVGGVNEKDFLRESLENISKAMNLNFNSAAYCTQKSLKLMKRGIIINISSICGMSCLCEDVPLYSSAKAALIAFSQVLAKSQAPKIRVNTISPGYTKTRFWDNVAEKEKRALIKQTPSKRWVLPEEIAQAAISLIEDDSKTGENIVVANGRIFK